jgi:4a-hydroxytetrahydrobiopterin dehydratase
MERRKVSEQELAEAMRDLPEWSVQEGKLRKQYRFSTFGDALGWMVRVGVFADKLDHHPDWCNSYNKVTVELITHDLKALSNWDLELARKMDALYGSA